MRLAFLISEEGLPRDVRVDSSTLRDPDVVRCQKQAIQRLSFPAPKTPVTVKLTVHFDPGGASPNNHETASPLPNLVFAEGNEKWRDLGETERQSIRNELENNNSTPDALLRSIRALIQNGLFQDALAQAKELSERVPNGFESHELLAQAYALNGEFEKAAAAISTLVELSPQDSTLQFRIAKTYENVGDTIRACAHWRAVRSLTQSRWPQAIENRCGISSPIGTTNLEQERKVVRGPYLDTEPSYAKAILQAQLVCDSSENCPVLIVVGPKGQVWSTLMPESPEASDSIRAPLSPGLYRVLLVGAGLPAKGFVRLSAEGATQTYPFEGVSLKTIATADYQLASNPHQ